DTRAFFEHVARLGIELEVYLHEQELYFYQNFSAKIRLSASLDLLKTGEHLESIGVTPVYFSWPQKDFVIQPKAGEVPRIFWTITPTGIVTKKTAVLQEIVPTPVEVPMRRKVKSALKILKNKYLD
ncbi:MAG: hypothetical protein K2X47_18900, partial [Bdellovibrionales bacterium]|nr:hypothetical protein [Bdellovibrionales bacterium]